MSSPAPRRSQRNSASATPVRATRNSRQVRSSPAIHEGHDPSRDVGTPSRVPEEPEGQATPRASRPPVLSSSPLFFQSSPIRGPAGGNAAENGRMDISSPLRQTSLAEATPRQGLQVPGGTPKKLASCLSP